jgi:hypothetical protein
MAELDCFITLDEFADILGRALDEGFSLCLNKNVLDPQYEYVNQKESVRELLHQKQYAYILERKDFTRFPAQLRPIQREGSTVWYPRPREGGPNIEAYFFGDYVKEGLRFVACSLFAHGTKILNPSTGREEPAGGEVNKAFQSLLAPLKREAARVRSTKRTAYVSAGVQVMLKSGWRLAPPFTDARW